MSLMTPEPAVPQNANLEEAVALLLRSPRLSLSRVLELLDLSDADFRRMCAGNGRISALLEARRNGNLREERPDIATCPGCGDWFVPYAGERCCSDECRTIDRIERRRRVR